MTGSVFARALPRAYVRICILLLLSEGPSHGYEIVEQTHELGWSNVDAGSLYRSLRRMERDELVRSWWERSRPGPARRTYALTARGAGALDEGMVELGDVARTIDEMVTRFDGLAGSRTSG